MALSAPGNKGGENGIIPGEPLTDFGSKEEDLVTSLSLLLLASSPQSSTSPPTPLFSFLHFNTQGDN